MPYEVINIMDDDDQGDLAFSTGIYASVHGPIPGFRRLEPHERLSSQPRRPPRISLSADDAKKMRLHMENRDREERTMKAELEAFRAQQIALAWNLDVQIINTSGQKLKALKSTPTAGIADVQNLSTSSVMHIRSVEFGFVDDRGVRTGLRLVLEASAGQTVRLALYKAGSTPRLQYPRSAQGYNPTSQSVKDQYVVQGGVINAEAVFHEVTEESGTGYWKVFVAFGALVQNWALE